MKTKQLLLVAMAFFIVGSGLFAQKESSPTPPKANYQLAARFSPARLQKLFFSTAVEPQWMKKSNRFWYMYQTTSGKRWMLADPDKGTKKPLFDHVKMASNITRIVKDAFDAQHLVLENIKFTDDENSFRFEVTSTIEEIKKNTPPKKEKKVFFFEYNLLTQELVELKGREKEKPIPFWASFSPDKKYVVFMKQQNLYYMDSANFSKALRNEDDSTIVETKLTSDGVPYFSYGFAGNETNVEKEKNKNKRKSAGIFWSPDSKYFASIRTDNRLLKEAWVIHSIANPRPELETYRFVAAGDSAQYSEELFVFDFINKTKRIINTSAYKNQDMIMYQKTRSNSEANQRIRPVIWMGTNDRFYFKRTSRDWKRMDICAVDINGADVAKAIIEERNNTYVDQINIEVINNGNEIIHWSERDGWAHYYLYDKDGKLKNQITSGEFRSDSILKVDEKNRVLYFYAEGVEAGQDPFYRHACKANLDGTGFTVLNPGNVMTAVDMSDDAKYFVSTGSRVNLAPQSVLYDNLGRKTMELETADLQQLMEAGYKFPQPIKVKAADGITDLYGVMYKPYDFDSTKSYPIIVYVYPGPQRELVPRTFAGKFLDKSDRMAQFGYIYVSIGNRGGSPNRSKWYHDYGYGDMRDYGLADIKTAVEQLAYRHSYIDLNRVGIHGHSGGGFMTAAAMLAYPDFFKVGVSSSSNHENQLYNHWWSEKYHGIKEVVSEKSDTSFIYSIEKNPDLVKNLKGHLLISTGDIDNNVNPAQTIRMANALIKANKRFDFVILPGQRHQYDSMWEYFFWVMADYFNRHLMGDTTERPVDILEIQRDIEKTQ
jgi:dipeptidyl-peptidase-4